VGGEARDEEGGGLKVAEEEEERANKLIAFTLLAGWGGGALLERFKTSPDATRASWRRSICAGVGVRFFGDSNGGGEEEVGGEGHAATRPLEFKIASATASTSAALKADGHPFSLRRGGKYLTNI
jgi:hypothetical protein